MNVFVVRTPLQLLNALEAQRVFDVRRSALVVITNARMSRHLAAMIDMRDWEEVHDLQDHHHTSGLKSRFSVIWRGGVVRRRLDRLVHRWPQVDRLFLGNLNDAFCRHLANVVRCRETVVLDDGTATIGIARRRAQGVVARRRGHEAWRAALYDRLMGVRTRETDRLVFFTSYDVEVGSRDRVVRNGFARLRGHATRRQIGDTVLFLGQPLVEAGEMVADRYAAYVKAAVEHLGEEGFVYVPHWQESTRLVHRLRTELRLEVVRPAVPIEVELVRSRRLPRVLASFHCSALDNCRRMLGGSGMQITAFEIASEHLERSHDFIASVYAYLRERSDDDLTVVPLHEAVSPTPAITEIVSIPPATCRGVLPPRVEPTQTEHVPSS